MNEVITELKQAIETEQDLATLRALALLALEGYELADTALQEIQVTLGVIL